MHGVDKDRDNSQSVAFLQTFKCRLRRSEIIAIRLNSGVNAIRTAGIGHYTPWQ